MKYSIATTEYAMKTTLMIVLLPLSTAGAFEVQSRSSVPTRFATTTTSTTAMSALKVASNGNAWDESLMTLSSANSTSSDDLMSPPPPPRKEVVMSPSIPFLECPSVLVDCDLAGNVGFDPFGFARTKEDLMLYREAEVKHARLAMLAAVGWPISELLDRKIADYFGMDTLLDAYDRAPSLLNGGLERVSPVWWGTCLGLTAAIDLDGIAKARLNDPNYFPGKLDFDPLNMYPKDKVGRARMELAEIKHGRLAMLAVAAYMFQEFVTKLAVIDETPFFFFPLNEGLERMGMM